MDRNQLAPLPAAVSTVPLSTMPLPHTNNATTGVASASNAILNHNPTRNADTIPNSNLPTSSSHQPEKQPQSQKPSQVVIGNGQQQEANHNPAANVNTVPNSNLPSTSSLHEPETQSQKLSQVGIGNGQRQGANHNLPVNVNTVPNSNLPTNSSQQPEGQPQPQKPSQGVIGNGQQQEANHNIQGNVNTVPNSNLPKNSLQQPEAQPQKPSQVVIGNGQQQEALHLRQQEIGDNSTIIQKHSSNENPVQNGKSGKDVDQKTTETMDEVEVVDMELESVVRHCHERFFRNPKAQVGTRNMAITPNTNSQPPKLSSSLPLIEQQLIEPPILNLLNPFVYEMLNSVQLVRLPLTQQISKNPNTSVKANTIDTKEESNRISPHRTRGRTAAAAAAAAATTAGATSKKRREDYHYEKELWPGVECNGAAIQCFYCQGRNIANDQEKFLSVTSQVPGQGRIGRICISSLHDLCNNIQHMVRRHTQFCPLVPNSALNQLRTLDTAVSSRTINMGGLITTISKRQIIESELNIACQHISQKLISRSDSWSLVPMLDTSAPMPKEYYIQNSMFGNDVNLAQNGSGSADSPITIENSSRKHKSSHQDVTKATKKTKNGTTKSTSSNTTVSTKRSSATVASKDAENKETESSNKDAAKARKKSKNGTRNSSKRASTPTEKEKTENNKSSNRETTKVTKKVEGRTRKSSKRASTPANEKRFKKQKSSYQPSKISDNEKIHGPLVKDLEQVLLKKDKNGRTNIAMKRLTLNTLAVSMPHPIEHRTCSNTTSMSTSTSAKDGPFIMDLEMIEPHKKNKKSRKHKRRRR